MKSPATPQEEPARLASLESLDVLDTPAEERFDRITRLAKALFHVPIALVSLVDEERQWFKSRQGLTACSTPREISFCGHAILQRHTFLVENALEDERFRDNPLVAGPPGIRFYAGYPLQDGNGLNLGTLCLIDTQPRSFTPQEMRQLTDLAQLAERELAAPAVRHAVIEPEAHTPAERRAKLDEATGVWSAEGMRDVLAHGLAVCAENRWPAMVLRCELDQEAELSETWSNQGRDMILAEVAQVLRGSIRTYDSIGRIGAEGFLLLLSRLPTSVAAQRLTFFQDRLDQNPVLQAIGVRLRLAYACVVPDDHPVDLDELLQAASVRLGLAA